MANKTVLKTTKLSLPQKRFVDYVAQTGKVGQSSLRAGFSTRGYGSVLMAQPKIQTALQLAFKKAGLTDERVAKVIDEGLKAKYPEQLYKGGGVKQAAAPDHFSRVQYLDKLMKARGDYAPERHEVVTKTLNVVVTMDMGRGMVDAGAITDAEFEELQTLPQGEQHGRQDGPEDCGPSEEGSSQDISGSPEGSAVE